MFIREETTCTYTISKSIFIAYLKRCKSEEEYKNYLAEIRKKHYDASHVCSAFVLGSIKRSSDDKEPSGTAGRPILNVLEKKGLDETCALVVRYFGGIKLGAGGLTRAYGTAVSKALENAKFCENVIYKVYSLKLNYEDANKVDYFLQNNVLLIDKKYDTEVEYIFGIIDDSIINKITEITKGIKPIYLKDEIKEKEL